MHHSNLLFPLLGEKYNLSFYSWRCISSSGVAFSPWGQNQLGKGQGFFFRKAGLAGSFAKIKKLI